MAHCRPSACHSTQYGGDRAGVINGGTHLHARTHSLTLPGSPRSPGCVCVCAPAAAARAA
eukprot:104767-Pelagomonas_calceolata.AAC.3